MFITAQLPPQLFVRVFDMCHRMGYNHSYIDAHYIFGAFREVLKGKTTLLDEGTYGYLIKYYFIVDNHSVTIRTIGLR